MQKKTPLNEPFSNTDDVIGEELKLLVLHKSLNELDEEKEEEEKKK